MGGDDRDVCIYRKCFWKNMEKMFNVSCKWRRTSGIEIKKVFSLWYFLFYIDFLLKKGKAFFGFLSVFWWN
jgi:hypothetical protein